MNIVFMAIYWFLPAYVANGVPPILGSGKPIDFGRNFIDGRRILGKGKTIRGTFYGILFGTLVGYLVHDLTLGFLLSLGALLGDIIASFIKRRLGIKSGSPLLVADQLDFVIGALLLASLYSSPSLKICVVIFLVTPLIHICANYTAFKLGLKKVWW